jgi:hypothetical protein
MTRGRLPTNANRMLLLKTDKGKVCYGYNSLTSSVWVLCTKISELCVG